MKILFGVSFIFIIVSISLPLYALASPTQCGGPGLPRCSFSVCGSTQDDIRTTYDETQPCTFCSIFQLIKKVVDFFLFPDFYGPNSGIPVVPAVASLLIAVGAFFILIGSQNPAQLKKGQDILKDVAIGLIIVYGAWLFVGFFLQAFGVANWQGIGMDLTKWWQIPCSQ